MKNMSHRTSEVPVTRRRQSEVFMGYPSSSASSNSCITQKDIARKISPVPPRLEPNTQLSGSEASNGTC